MFGVKISWRAGCADRELHAGFTYHVRHLGGLEVRNKRIELAGLNGLTLRAKKHTPMKRSPLMKRVTAS